jgi:hypothetical protein
MECFVILHFVSVDFPFVEIKDVSTSVPTLVIISFLDKNPRWVTDDSFYEDFPEDY